nr:site-specific integrase [Phytoactinopolyspora alkaliphila]
MDHWLDVLDVDTSTKRGYVNKINKHIRPNLGNIAVGKVDVELLDLFYAQLKKCRDHCHGRRYVQHRTAHNHVCDEHVDSRCEPPQPGRCRACKRACREHRCKGLADSTVRQIHWILSGALSRAVRWGWIGVNPADHAEPPSLPHPDPQPPSPTEAARIVNDSWAHDPEWGALIWITMTSGARRAEMCALRIRHFDDENGVLTLGRAIYKDDNGELQEKDTKTHQQRRVVLDPESCDVLREHINRLRARVKKLDIDLSPDAYLFSPAPDCRVARNPDAITRRYDRMAERLGIKTTFHRLRHYSATELILAGVNVRAVAGRLGHGGGGATTLRVYAAWTSEADQRAAAALSARMPPRPDSKSGKPPETIDKSNAEPAD